MATNDRISEISCVNKNPRLDPYRAIERVGGKFAGGWTLSLAEAIDMIKNSQWQFYVERPLGDPVMVEVATSRYGNDYLKTEADGDEPNNLLSLPECR